MNILTKFWQDYGILKVFFFVMTFYFSIEEFYVFFHVKPTMTSTSRVALDAEDFPEITLCPEPTADRKALRELGYTELFNFKAGVEMYPVAQDQGHGWIGNSSERVEDVMRKVATVKSSDDCPVSILSNLRPVGVYNQSTYPFQFKISRALLPFHQCCKIIYPEIAKKAPIQGFAITLEPDQEKTYKSLKVLMADRMSYSVLKQNVKTIYGDDIKIPSEPGFNMYQMKVFQTVHYEEEPKYPCKDYQNIGEYDKCLEDDLLDELHKIANITPPWLTDNSDLWWRENITFKSGEIRAKYYLLFEKVNFLSYYTKKCLVPCRRNTFELKHNGMLESANNSGFAVWLDRFVSRTTSEPQISPMTLITRLGGIIGVGKNLLWIIVLLFSSITFITRKCRRQKKKTIHLDK